MARFDYDLFFRDPTPNGDCSSGVETFKATMASAACQSGHAAFAGAPPPAGWTHRVSPALLECCPAPRAPRRATRRSLATTMAASSEDAPRALRRRAVLSALMAGTVASLVGSGDVAHAEGGGRVWGAAELDFRMYVCGATSKFCPAMTKVKVAPARQVDAALARDVSEIPGRVLVTAFAKRGKLLPDKLKESAAKMSETLLPEFQKRAFFDPDDKANQYSLDFDTYVNWKAVAALLPQPNDRVLFQKSVGAMVLQSLDASVEPYDARSEGLEEAFPAVTGLLETAKKRGLIGTFTVDSSDYDPGYGHVRAHARPHACPPVCAPDSTPSAWSSNMHARTCTCVSTRYWSSDSGSPSTLLSLTIDTPVGLQACLQLGGEGVGIKPDLIGSAIAAYFEACGVSAEADPYFVDPVYRPNPNDYQPSQLILQYNLRPLGK